MCDKAGSAIVLLAKCLKVHIGHCNNKRALQANRGGNLEQVSHVGSPLSLLVSQITPLRCRLLRP